MQGAGLMESIISFLESLLSVFAYFYTVTDWCLLFVCLLVSYICLSTRLQNNSDGNIAWFLCYFNAHVLWDEAEPIRFNVQMLG